jgi:hypothetical protein
MNAEAEPLLVPYEWLGTLFITVERTIPDVSLAVSGKASTVPIVIGWKH